jgi:hypothetical protein
MTFAPFEMVNPLPKDRITFKYSGSTNGNGWSTEGPSPYTMTGEMIATLCPPVYGKYDPA